MKVKSTVNGKEVECDEKTGALLVVSGKFEEVKEASKEKEKSKK